MRKGTNAKQHRRWRARMRLQDQIKREGGKRSVGQSLELASLNLSLRNWSPDRA